MKTNNQSGTQVDAMMVIEQLRQQLSQVQYDLAIAHARLAQYQTRETHDLAEPVRSDG